MQRHVVPVPEAKPAAEPDAARANSAYRQRREHYTGYYHLRDSEVQYFMHQFIRRV